MTKEERKAFVEAYHFLERHCEDDFINDKNGEKWKLMANDMSNTLHNNNTFLLARLLYIIYDYFDKRNRGKN